MQQHPPAAEVGGELLARVGADGDQDRARPRQIDYRTLARRQRPSFLQPRPLLVERLGAVEDHNVVALGPGLAAVAGAALPDAVRLLARAQIRQEIAAVEELATTGNLLFGGAVNPRDADLTIRDEGDTLVVDSDGLHGAVERSAPVALERGLLPKIR